MILGNRVATNVKSIRLSRGISQQKLATKTGLTVRYISRLENTSPNVTLEVLERLTKGLGCSIVDLVGDKEEEKPVFANHSKEMLDDVIHFLQSLRSRM